MPAIFPFIAENKSNDTYGIAGLFSNHSRVALFVTNLAPISHCEDPIQVSKLFKERNELKTTSKKIKVSTLHGK